MNTYKKRGISLLVLLVTIVVTAVLLSVVIIRTNDSRENARKVQFIKDLETIQSSVRSYMLMNNSFPIPTSGVKSSFNESELLELNTDINLHNEIVENKDERDTFYLVNLSLLDLGRISYGLEYDTPGSKDVFVISKDKMNIYYLNGRKINGSYKYSLSYRLTGNLNSQNGSMESTGDTVNTTSTDRIKLINHYSVLKDTKPKVEIQLLEGESIKINTTTFTSEPESRAGENVFDITEIASSEQISEIETTGSFTVQIENADGVIEEKNIYLPELIKSNVRIFDDDLRAFNTNDNSLTFSVNTDGMSAVVKYEYLEVFDENVSRGYIDYMASLGSTSKKISHIRKNGKNATISNNKVTINVPKNVKKIFVILETNNGTTVYAEKDVYGFYSNTKYVSYANNSLNVLTNIMSEIGTNATISYSTNGTTYTQLKSVTTASTFEKINSSIPGINNSTNQNIYVKTTITSGGQTYDFVDKLSVIDEVAPTVKSIEADKSPTNITTITYTVTMSENVTLADRSNIVVNNGNIDSLTINEKVVTIVVKNATENATNRLTISPGAFQDTASNLNRDNKSTSVVVDTEAPYVTVTVDPNVPVTNLSSVTYKFQWNEAVTGFTKDSLTVTNGTVKTFTGSGASYTAVVTNTGSCNQTVEVKTNKCTDLAENSNNVAESKSIEIDRTLATINVLEVTSPEAGTYDEGTEVTIRAEFTETLYNSNGNAITLNDVPTLYISFGDGTARAATAQQVTNSKVVTYKVTINSEDTGLLRAVTMSGNIYDRVGNVTDTANIPLNLTGNQISSKNTDVFVKLYSSGLLTFDNVDTTLSNETLVKDYGNIKNNNSSSHPWYSDSESVTKVRFIHKVYPINVASFFRNMSNLTQIENISNLNTSYSTDMQYMFNGCSNLTSLDLSSFDTSKVTTMYSMFNGCSSLTSLNVSSFNTTKVNNMVNMFHSCSKITSLNLSNFNTSNVTDMNYMFYNCSSLTSLNLSNFNTSEVTNMSEMFFGCSSLTSLNLSSFDTSKVTNMRVMFGVCSSLTSLNLSNFDTSEVTNMDGMFYDCLSLTSLNLSSFDTSKVTNMDQMFCDCSSLTSLVLNNFDTSKVTELYGMFWGCSSLTSLNLSSFDTSKVTNMSGMFCGCSSLTSLNLSSFDTSMVISMRYMFVKCSSLTSLNLSSFDTSKVP